MKIEFNINKIPSIKKIVSKLIVENDFNCMNHLINQNEADFDAKFLFPNAEKAQNTEFVSVKKTSKTSFEKLLTEKEFFKTAGVNKRGLSKNSGRFQEWLYAHYIEASKQKDDGYLYDVLSRALEFRRDLKYVKSLIKNKTFALKWHEDFGDESALDIFKHQGSLRLFNIVKYRN